MSALRVATTINPRFDHVTPIEATRSAVTITHRCHMFAELLAVARSGLVDIVVIADEFELVGLEAIQQLTHDAGQHLKIAGLSDVADDRQRLATLGIPVASPHDSGAELVAWLLEVSQGTVPGQAPGQAGDPDHPSPASGPRIAERLDHIAAAPRRSSSTTVTEAVKTPEPDGSPTADGHRDAADSGSAPPRGQLIAVWGPIGAPGATTVAVNLAAEAAVAGHRTLLIDANTYGAAVAVHLGLLDDTAAIAQACRAAEQAPLDGAGLAQFTQRVMIGPVHVDVMTGLTRAERWPQVRAAAWQRILQVAREGWETIIIDCGFGLEQDEELSFDIPAPQRNATTLSALGLADTVVAVGTGDPVGFVRFMKGVDQLSQLDTARIVTVVNKVSPLTSGIGPKRQLATVWDRFGPSIGLEHFLPWAPDVVATALFEAKTLAERAPKTPLRRGLQQLINSVTPGESTVRSRRPTTIRRRQRAPRSPR